jgi:hypothetical protein
MKTFIENRGAVNPVTDALHNHMGTEFMGGDFARFHGKMPTSSPPRLPYPDTTLTIPGLSGQPTVHAIMAGGHGHDFILDTI